MEAQANGVSPPPTAEMRGPDTDNVAESMKRLRLRNYVPHDAGLQVYCEDTASAEEIVRLMEDSHEALLKDAAQRFASPALDIENKIPKKVAWDLKNALAPQLERLERRTQVALDELARSNASSQMQDGSDDAGQRLARTVHAMRGVDAHDDDDDN